MVSCLSVEGRAVEHTDGILATTLDVRRLDFVESATVDALIVADSDDAAAAVVMNSVASCRNSIFSRRYPSRERCLSFEQRSKEISWHDECFGNLGIAWNHSVSLRRCLSLAVPPSDSRYDVASGMLPRTKEIDGRRV